ncbi:alpha/beta fold hydrolase [Nonomuraea fuscirosea]|uniref:alpha/beta fold hydrolase n=1 Tax=Nonomuraea fuscirosea TaxID=1291556 RepID=UPI0033C0294D
MPFTSDVEIYYETAGDPSGEPLVLIEGFGGQLIGWHEEFCALLADAGFHLIRLDNRDVGLSQKFGGPEDVDGGYGLSDMADDVVRVLDALGLESAHVAGRSMGGMIAQTLAIEHPRRVRGLALFYSIPGRSPRYVLHGEHPERLTVQPRHGRDEVIAYAAAAHREARPDHPESEVAWARDRAAEAYDRCYAPDGMARQWAALMRAPERLERLRAVGAPTALVHGRDDPLLHWHASADMAEAIPGSELHVYPGMGHWLERHLWPDYVAAITRTASRYESALAAAGQDAG